MKHNKEKETMNINIVVYKDDVEYIRKNFKVTLSYIIRELLQNQVMMFRYYDNLKDMEEGETDGKEN